MVSFIYNGSEKTTWMGVQLENQKRKFQSNILKTRTSFLNFKLQIIKLAQGHWCWMPTLGKKHI